MNEPKGAYLCGGQIRIQYHLYQQYEYQPLHLSTRLDSSSAQSGPADFAE